MLRVLWQTAYLEEFTDNCWGKFGLAEFRGEAQELLDNYQAWKDYCYPWTPNTDDIANSTFSLARYFQILASNVKDSTVSSTVTFSPRRLRSRQQALEMKLKNTHIRNAYETPSKITGSPRMRYRETGSGDEEEEQEEDTPLKSDTPGPREIWHLIHPPTKDEQIVNTALINFLTALILHHRFSSRWNLHRMPFKADFKNASFEARIDGYLEDRATGKVRALVEVKAAFREHKRKQICMQEAAQMVGWILNDNSDEQMKPGR